MLCVRHRGGPLIGLAALARTRLAMLNCELFQVLFKASANDNYWQTSAAIYRWDTRALLLALK